MSKQRNEKEIFILGPLNQPGGSLDNDEREREKQALVASKITDSLALMSAEISPSWNWTKKILY